MGGLSSSDSASFAATVETGYKQTVKVDGVLGKCEECEVLRRWRSAASWMCKNKGARGLQMADCVVSGSVDLH